MRILIRAHTGTRSTEERLANQILRIEEERGAATKYAGEKFRHPHA